MNTLRAALALVSALCISLLFAHPASATTIKDLENAINALQAQVTTLQQTVATQAAELNSIKSNKALALDPYVTIDTNTINGLNGPHVIFTGVNVHIRSGSGATDDYTTPTGLGNLVVGYNEEPNCPTPSYRGGSHNVVIGSKHGYSSYAGVVVGDSNNITGPYSSVSGGHGNTASGLYSSVSGGSFNSSSGKATSISGGGYNHASGGSGGIDTVLYSGGSISGGYACTASGIYSSVSGGKWNTASGDDGSSVSGGQQNYATGVASTVSGGLSHTASDEHSWVGGIYSSSY